MIPGGSSFGTVLGINARLAYACILGGIAWLIWPDSLIGYGWGMLSIILGLSALALVIDALRAIAKLHARQKALAAYMAQGEKPKTAQMASPDDLNHAGMSDV